MANHVLKGALFGGFKRSDVIGYIEESSKESAEIVKKLQEENDALHSEKDVLLAQLAEKQELSEKLEMLSREKTALSERLEATEGALAQAEAERDSLRAELEHAKPLAEEYQSIRNQLSEIQIEACRRAKEVEMQTNSRLLSLIGDCRSAYEAAFFNRFPAAFDELEQSLRAESTGGEAPAAEEPAAENLFTSPFTDIDFTHSAIDAPVAPTFSWAEYDFGSTAAPTEPKDAEAEDPVEAESSESAAAAPEAEVFERPKEISTDAIPTEQPDETSTDAIPAEQPEPVSTDAIPAEQPDETSTDAIPAEQPVDWLMETAPCAEAEKPLEEAEKPEATAEETPAQENAPEKEDSPFTFSYDDFKL